MHRLLIILLLTLCASISMSAQNDTLFVESSPELSAEEYPGILTRRGAKLYLDGRFLTESESMAILSSYDDFNLADKWEINTTLRNTGIGFVISTGCVLLLSAAMYYSLDIVDDNSQDSLIIPLVFMKGLIYASAPVGLPVCSATLLVGAALWLTGSSGMSKTVKLYNGTREATFSLGLTSTGNFGLALNF